MLQHGCSSHTLPSAGYDLCLPRATYTTGSVPPEVSKEYPFFIVKPLQEVFGLLG